MSSLVNNQSGGNLYTQGFGNRPENVEIPHVDTRAPRLTDTNYPIGKRWIDTVGTTEYSLMGTVAFAGVVTANWVLLGSTAGALNTLSDQTAIQTFPIGGNIQLTGTSNQTVTTSGIHEITWSLDPVLITPGSLEVTGLLTGDAGATLNTAGTAMNIAADNDGSNVNVGTAGGRTITIGDYGGSSFAVQQINIGNPYKSSSVSLISGTAGSISLNTGIAGTVVLNGSLDSTIAIIGGGGVVSISNDAANSPLIIGSQGDGSSTTIYCGSGNMELAGGGNTIDIGSDAGNIITIGTGAFVTTVTVGSTNSISSLALNAGSGNINVTGLVNFGSTFTSAPSDSNTVTTAFATSLTLNTAVQNTTGYDLLCNISLHVTAATAATITLGVGPSSPPTDNTVVASFSTAVLEIINFVAYVPNNYYLLYNKTGTITIASATVQSMGI